MSYPTASATATAAPSKRQRSEITSRVGTDTVKIEMSLAQLQDRLQTASREFQKIQEELQTAVDARQKLDAQQTENEEVKKEFAQLKEKSVVYKMIGPVLVKQDQTEAKNNVNTRLEFIGSEIRRIEDKLKTIEAKSNKKRDELVEIQTAIQQQQASSGNEIASA